MSKFNPDNFKTDKPISSGSINHSNPEKKVSTNRKQHQFLKGPIPLPWLIIAEQLPGKTYVVALAIWFRAGLCKSMTLTLPSVTLKQFGIDRSAKKRALNHLESVSLITVVRTNGKNPTITILEVEE